MKKCTGKNCPMRVGYDYENCSATEKCPFRTWPATISDRIRNMTDNELHGRWEMRPTGMATDTGPEYKAYCTVCNEPNKQYQPPFCPHCGAKMDGERKDGGDG